MGQGNWRIIKRKYIGKEKLGIFKCRWCGKEYENLVKVYRTWRENIEDKKVKESLIKAKFGYPKNSCHCRCGVEWGKHFDDKVKWRTRGGKKEKDKLPDFFMEQEIL